MSATNRPLWSGLPVKVIGSIAILAFLAFLMVPQNRIDDDDSVGDQNTEVADDVDEQSECSRELARIVNGMQPGRLGIVSDATDLAAELNRWFAKCGGEIDEDLTQDVETQRKLVSPEIFAVLQTERFLPEDIAYVRQCLLAKAVAAQVCANLTDDTQRVLALFQFLSRQLVAVDSQETAAPVLPASPYETLLWGQGSAADRAWAFATLLQQLRIDAMVIVPRQQPEHWLLGVNLVDQGILLFDPHLGLPIPGNEDAADTPYPTAVASLTEVLQDDGPFRKLDLPDHPYPLQKNDLENLSIQLIGSPSQWSDRMARLQYMVAPIEAVDVYDGLGENALRPGASQLSRIAKLGTANKLWTEESIEIWEYPVQQMQQLALDMANDQSFYSLKMQIFAGPQIPKLDARTGQIMIRAADETLHAVRIEQLRGENSAALLHFGPILTSYRTNPTPLNTDAANYAAFWTGMSQYETQKFSAASNTFERFVSTLRQSPTQLVPINAMQLAAANWKAIALSSAGLLDEAIQALKDAQTMQFSHRNAYLMKRWELLKNAQANRESND